MTANDEASPRPGSTADLVRRVERLELSHSELAKAVNDQGHKLDLVQLEQKHASEMMNSKFSGLEKLAEETSRDLKDLLKFIQSAMSGAPEAQSPATKAMIEEYRDFQREVFEHMKTQTLKSEEFDDYILVQKTKSETTKGLAQRAFGSSVVGAVGACIGIALGILALLNGCGS